MLPLAAMLALAACSGGGSSSSGDSKGKRGQTGPAQVGYVVVQPGSVALTTELSGRVTAYQSSEVRPQVAGIVQRRYFEEGSIVKQGQMLYRIDPSLYQASAAQASANLQSAQANADAAKIKADRYKPLADMEAVSKQDYTDAAASARQASASVAQNRAQLRTAQINLRFTRVEAPITGRIGRSLVTEGSLVTANQTDPMTTIQRLDPIYVDIQQSSADLLALRRSLAQGGVLPASAAVKLTLEDGSPYALTGTVQFSEVMVSETTGTVTMRASFSNPDGLLLPGMFVHATLAQAVDPNAFLVPQAAVVRDAKGNAKVWLVGPDGKAKQVEVKADRTQGAYWVVTSGLNPGDKVITQGTANLKSGAEIKAVPADTPQKIEPSKGDKSGGASSSGQRKGG